MNPQKFSVHRLRAFSLALAIAAVLAATVSRSHADLIGHWTFETDNELNDLTGNFPDLLLVGTASVSGGALDVNGTGTTATGWERRIFARRGSP